VPAGIRPYRLGEPGRLAVDHLSRRLGRHVVRGQARAPGGEEETHALLVCEPPQRGCDRVAIVRHGRLVALEDVGSLIARRKRNVELRFEGDTPVLDGLAGVSDVRIVGDRLTCLLEGDVEPFLRAIRDTRVRDLTIEPARLEDAFLEYYADDVERAVPA
jgi:hypothetical protein